LKSIIRRQINQQRKNLTTQQVEVLSSQICKKIIDHECFYQSKILALYSAFANEVNLSSLLDSDKIFLLPVINSNHGMSFKNYQIGDEVITNKYGILEPSESNDVNPNEIDLCLMPLVGFNRLGHRLGMGAGYYDRYFALNKSHKKPTILAGVAYDFQENDTIQNDDWDIPLNYIFTNKEVIKI
jgi:5-formyltetrahydrofolate cyclo-ligase